jgi:hypothetical protein
MTVDVKQERAAYDTLDVCFAQFSYLGLKSAGGRVAQSVQRLPTGWRSGDRIPVGETFSAPVQTGPPSVLYNRYRAFPGVSCGRGMMLTPHPLLMPRSKIE